jgi:hypothetical protein
MISREDLNTITRNRAEASQPVKYMSAAAVRSEAIKRDMEAFLSSGGKVEQIPFGKSSTPYDVSMPLQTIKAMEIARKKVNHFGIAKGRPREMAEQNDKTYIGAVCGYDGNTVRYRSNGRCKVCTIKSYNRRKEARDGKAN